MIQSAPDAVERTLRGERADMQFIQNGLFPGPSHPPGVVPGEGARLDHYARPVHILRLPAGCGIRPTKNVMTIAEKAPSGSGAPRRTTEHTLAPRLEHHAPDQR